MFRAFGSLTPPVPISFRSSDTLAAGDPAARWPMQFTLPIEATWEILP